MFTYAHVLRDCDIVSHQYCFLQSRQALLLYLIVHTFVSGVLQILGSASKPVLMIPEESNTKWAGLTVNSGKTSAGKISTYMCVSPILISHNLFIP